MSSKQSNIGAYEVSFNSKVLSEKHGIPSWSMVEYNFKKTGWVNRIDEVSFLRYDRTRLMFPNELLKYRDRMDIPGVF